jgi:hypothetical protein
VTPTDQDVAAERAAQALARRLRPLIPPPLLLDPLAFARQFLADMRAEHWKCIPPPKPVEVARAPGVPAEAHADELAEARKAFEAASDKHHSRETRKDDHDA